MIRRGVSNTCPREAGQVLIFFVMAFAVLAGFTAMTVDVGIILHERRSAQNAADAAALAAVTKLPPFGVPGEAQNDAFTWAQKNGYQNGVDSTTVQVTYPYDTDASKLEVEIERPVDFIFGRVLGLTNTSISARAVGQATFSMGGGGGYAIFVIDDSCNANDPLEISGSDNVVIGAVHSNSKIKVGGSNDEFIGDTTYSCSFQDGGSNNSYTPPPAQFGNRPTPLNYTYSSFPCNFTYNFDVDLTSRPEVWVGNNPSSKTLKDGVICSTGDIQLSGQDVRGNITLVAHDELKLSGSNFDIKGFWNDVLLFSDRASDPAMDLSGSGGNWEGYIFAPNARVKVQGQDGLSIEGSIIAKHVNVSGSDFSIDSTRFGAVSPGPGTVALIE